MLRKKLKMFQEATTEAAGEIIGIRPEVHEELWQQVAKFSQRSVYKCGEEVAM